MSTMRIHTSLKSVSCILGLFTFTLPTTGCMSSRVLTTGTSLPQASNLIEAPAAQLEIDHNCSGGWCKGFDVKVNNRLSEPLSLLVGQSEIGRAGERHRLATDDNKGRTLVIPAKDAKTFFLYPVAGDGTTRLKYFRATGVWCSVKASNSCKNSSKGEETCAGFARYYHQSYKDASGWIDVSLTLMAKSWENPEAFTTENPSVLPPPPPTQLGEHDEAPWWISGSGERVFHKVTCDDKCFCDDVTEKPSFQKDHGFKPLN